MGWATMSSTLASSRVVALPLPSLLFLAYLLLSMLVVWSDHFIDVHVG